MQNSKGYNFKNKEMMKMDGNDQEEENIKNWLLLEFQSTIDIFCNASLLNNIQEVEMAYTYKVMHVWYKLIKRAILQAMVTYGSVKRPL